MSMHYYGGIRRERWIEDAQVIDDVWVPTRVGLKTIMSDGHVAERISGLIQWSEVNRIDTSYDWLSNTAELSSDELPDWSFGKLGPASTTSTTWLAGSRTFFYSLFVFGISVFSIAAFRFSAQRRSLGR